MKLVVDNAGDRVFTILHSGTFVWIVERESGLERYDHFGPKSNVAFRVGVDINFKR